MDPNYNKDKDQVKISKEAGLVAVSGTKSQLDKVDKYVKQISHRLHRQILLETKIIQVMIYFKFN